MLLVDINARVMPATPKHLLFAVVVGLGILEKLSGTANMISMERDWIPLLASQTSDSTYSLTQLNAVMRRIDLICKLVSPVMISVVIAASGSTRIGVMVVAGMSALSWGVEIWCARRVWNTNPRLREPKVNKDVISGETLEPVDTLNPGWLQRAEVCLTAGFHNQVMGLRSYFGSDVWMPSLSGALLHLSVLSYSATLLTYLLDSGFSLALITIARTLGSVVEVSSTFVAPVGVQYLSRSSKDHLAREDTEALLDNQGPDAQDSGNQQHLAGLQRLGLWGLWSQFLNLVKPINSCKRANSSLTILGTGRPCRLAD